MTADEGRPEGPTRDATSVPESVSAIDEIAERIRKYVAVNCGSHPYEILGAALRRASTRWDRAAPNAPPRDGRTDVEIERQTPPQLPGGDEGSESPSLAESSVEGVVYQDATVWIFMTSFAGLAIAWASGGVAPWVGAAVGCGISTLAATLVIASRG
jgi:hypothetical protein